MSEGIVGIGRYASNLVRQFSTANEQVIPVDWRSPSELERLTGVPFSAFMTLPNKAPVLKTLLWHLFLLKRLEGKTEAMDLLFSPSQFLHPFGRLDIPFVYVLHDLSFLIFPQYHKHGKEYIFRLFFRRTLRKAALIVCDSEYTRSQLIRLYGESSGKACTIHLAAEGVFHPIVDTSVLDGVRSKYRLPEKFFLFVGTIEPRKNIAQLLRTYFLFRKEPLPPLYVIGRVGWKAGPIFRLHEELGLQNKVIFLGGVPDDDLAAIYNLATLFVIVSKDEGFGLPPLEAMQCGTPTVVSSAGSLPEIVADAAFIVDPQDPNAIGQALLKLSSDDSLREYFKRKGLERARQFSWQESSGKLLTLFHQLVR